MCCECSQNMLVEKQQFLEESKAIKNIFVERRFLVTIGRTLIFFCVFSLSVCFIYFTIIRPQHSYISCQRPCDDREWPMICRFKFTIELHKTTLSHSCKQCLLTDPAINCLMTNNCILADINQRPFLSINKQLPGPMIQVCKDDIIIIDVENHIPGSSLTIHWHGQEQRETPFMDGVPMVTQCPISSFSTFQYKFRASNVGTHLYHAFSEQETNDGLIGAFIVKDYDMEEKYKESYDIDSADHVIMINEWTKRLHFKNDDKKNDDNFFLINGFSPSPFPPKFHVEANKKYRYRLIYGSGTQGCPIKFSINNHTMKIIAIDGNAVESFDVRTIKIERRERIDFILDANQHEGEFFINISSTTNCSIKLESYAILIYDKNSTNNISEKINDVSLDANKNNCNDDSIPLNKIRSLIEFPQQLKFIDKTIYIPIINRKIEQFSFGNYYLKEDNISFTFPSLHPLLSKSTFKQNDEKFCNSGNRPEMCDNQNICECIHLEKLSMGDRVEIIFINNSNNTQINYHLHGYQVFIVGQENINEVNNIFRNFNNPILKDMILVPRKSKIIVRFIANNPGFWMLRDINANDNWTRGLDIILQVGNKSQMVMPPNGFPTCGNFIGPKFFLI